MRKIYKIMGCPVGAPRMTRADAWKKRPIVLKYRAWCDDLRKEVTGDPGRKYLGEDLIGFIQVIFYLPVRDSFSQKKKDLLNEQLHRVKPDIDNLLKGLMDALFEFDSRIASVQVEKRYTTGLPYTELNIYETSSIQDE